VVNDDVLDILDALAGMNTPGRWFFLWDRVLKGQTRGDIGRELDRARGRWERLSERGRAEWERRAEEEDRRIHGPGHSPEYLRRQRGTR
jgi:hypothetical protein